MKVAKKPKPDPEREIFNLDRSNRKEEAKPPRTVRVRVFDMIVECFKGKGYVEVEVDQEEDAFQDEEKDFGTINIKDEDI